MKNIKRLANERDEIMKAKQFATGTLGVEVLHICDNELRIVIKSYNDFRWGHYADNVKAAFSAGVEQQLRQLLPEIMLNALAAVYKYENDLVKATQDEALGLLVEIQQMQPTNQSS